MDPETDIHLLEIATGIRDSLIKDGFFTINSILNSTPVKIARALGIELYVAQIIFDAAKKAVNENSL
jgi:hypothetical protein